MGIEPDQELQINDQLLTQAERFRTRTTPSKLQAAHSDTPLAQFSSQILPPQDLLSNKIEIIPNTFETITNAAQKSQLIHSLNIELGNAEKWEALAATMLLNKKVSVGQGLWTAKNYYAAAISNDSEMAQAWIGLGRLLTSGEKVEINAKAYTKAKCFAEAEKILTH